MPRTAAKEKDSLEAVSYALAHRLRVEILTALNEGSYSSIQLTRILHQPLSTVSHHIEELLKGKRIEVAESKLVRGVERAFYRAVSTGLLTDEEMAALSPEARRAIYALVLQNGTAEALASLWAGKISDDPRTWLTWDWFYVDDEGRREIAVEQERSWARMGEIEAEAEKRARQSENPLRPIIVTSYGYERSRTPPSPET